MIEGVKIKLLKVNLDKRGDFRELLRFNEGLLDKIAQVSIGRTLPGVIKAFHWHKNQDDIFYVLKGNIRVVLYDPRENSTTKGITQELFLGESYTPQALFVPRGIFHGYQVIGEKEVEVLYIMNQVYDPSDEHRISYNDPSIGFNWDK